ncbi:MAG: hypothetical protein H0X38_06245 [Planctomycetes bacterium]|nr:hypothetical protein [Planctomycetota bacterium]
MRVPLILVTLGCAIAPAAASVWTQDGLTPLELVAIWEPLMSRDFDLVGVQGRWSKAERYGAELRLGSEPDEVIGPWGGLHVSWDTREGSFPGGDIDVHALMLALTGGVMFHFLPTIHPTNFDPGLAIFGRAGVGFQSGHFDNYPTDQGPVSGSVSPLRYEWALGTELQVTLFRRAVLTAGVGVTWWFANESTTVTSVGGTTTVAIDTSFSGMETWSRIGLGFRF